MDLLVQRVMLLTIGYQSKLVTPFRNSQSKTPQARLPEARTK
jgi:hypothetical protein